MNGGMAMRWTLLWVIHSCALGCFYNPTGTNAISTTEEQSATGGASATETQSSLSVPTEATMNASETETAAGSSTASASMTEAVSATDSESESTTVSGECDNGVQDDHETDIDCGGSCGSNCNVGQFCIGNWDCLTLNCEGELCAPDLGCSDGELTPGETDVDCGGQCGPTCEVDEGCILDSDCVSDNCAGTCQVPTCDDALQNGYETDVDCGGSCGPNCGTGELCIVDDDCASIMCDAGMRCADHPLCSNGMQDNGETDVDCGGPCGPSCEIDEGCDNNTDCVTNECAATMTCQEPLCDDGMQNGDETDIDCGGACGSTCESAQGCLVSSDCVDDYCSPLEVCAPQECMSTMDDNQCQSCIKVSCCETVSECLLDPKCACWLECVEQNNDFESCTISCDINGKPGPIMTCANSKCNMPEACDKP